MRESFFETLVGALVVAVAAVFLWFSLAVGGDAETKGDQYNVLARFNNVSGISRGSDVRIAGVKAGVVKSIEGDPTRFEAVLTLSLDKKWELPDDTDARISTDGLLGGSYIGLEPGGGFDTIPQDGSGEIQYTRGSVDLLTLFASFAGGGGGGGDAPVPMAEPAAEPELPPAPVARPDPKPAPAPVPRPAPKPEPKKKPEPVKAPEPEPVPAPAPEPAPSAAPEAATPSEPAVVPADEPYPAGDDGQ
ncbi:outer membrane lipid asymmetry maintenance protein MlaD [Hyphomonas sp.]|uniref:outer membrane lipid asymmetry maintenance protein MlaD n=1 Tax=Hyphomonas sp. TaxID=87 RepID=UPI0030F7C5F6